MSACSAGGDAEQSAPPPAAPAPQTSAPPVVSSPQSQPPAGGSAVMQETVGALNIQNTLMESQMQAEAGATAGGQVARDQLKKIDSDRAAEMDEVLESMDP